MSAALPVKWTRDHLFIALNLYCKLPFGQVHHNNPLIVEVAAKMGRTGSSLSMKLGNFASFDPVLKARGVRGLTGASKQDRAIWDEFQARTAELGVVSEELMHDLFTRDEGKEVDFLERDRVRVTGAVAPAGPTEAMGTVRLRRGQQFFRQAVLNAYGMRCCISGIPAPRLLVASHIKPWKDFPENWLDPGNGLCLSALHDAAFDEGLITLDEARCVVLSPRLKQYFPQRALEENFVPYEGRVIELPHQLAEPKAEFLEYHRDVVFKD